MSTWITTGTDQASLLSLLSGLYDIMAPPGTRNAADPSVYYGLYLIQGHEESPLYGTARINISNQPIVVNALASNQALDAFYAPMVVDNDVSAAELLEIQGQITTNLGGSVQLEDLIAPYLIAGAVDDAKMELDGFFTYGVSEL